jgi:hypothetical protein
MLFRICYVFVHSIFLSVILFHLVCPPLSSCLLVKNTNKGEAQSSGCSFEYTRSSFIQFVHLLSSFILFVGEEHQQRQGTPKKARRGCSFEYTRYSFIQFVHLLSSFILFVGEEHQQRRGVNVFQFLVERTS